MRDGGQARVDGLLAPLFCVVLSVICANASLRLPSTACAYLGCPQPPLWAGWACAASQPVMAFWIWRLRARRAPLLAEGGPGEPFPRALDAVLLAFTLLLVAMPPATLAFAFAAR